MRDLDDRLTRMNGTVVDVVILGAGINGAGLFRDMCEQDISCLIIDKGDFGSGTSAAPSRLIHGGLKYLETGEFRLVAQSTLERNLLLQNAPHFVRPLPTVIPIFSWTRGIWPATRTLFGSTTAPRGRGAVLIKIGLALYDHFGARHRTMPRHRVMGRRRALAETPDLTDRIVAAGVYHDARITHPERLVWELVRDGLDACRKSAAVNWTDLVSTGNGTLIFRTAHGAPWSIRPRIVINAAGPWIDRVNGLLGAPSKLIGGTKGSHVLLDNDALLQRLGGRMIYFEADDSRICLIYEYLGRVLAGSTDLPADDPDSVLCEDDEIGYLLDSIRALFPGLEISRDQIVYAYSGIRPLPSSDAAAPGLISRDHSAPVAEPTCDRPFPIISLVGGKWTTFRGFAEEVSDIILARLYRTRVVSTRGLAIGGGHDYPRTGSARQAWIGDVATDTGLQPKRVAQLLARYGTLAKAIAKNESAGAGTFLSDAADYSAAEIEWIVRNESVVHLEDIVKRRTTLAIEGRLTLHDLNAIAQIAATALGWDERRKEREISALKDNLSRMHRCSLQ